MKQFTTAMKEGSDGDMFADGEPIEFAIDGDTFIATPPSSTQFALFMASQASTRTTADKMAGVIDFIDWMLSDEDRLHLRARLLDRDDALDYDLLCEVMEGLVEEWSARPTRSPSDSPQSPQSTGRRSTGKAPS